MSEEVSGAQSIRRVISILRVLAAGQETGVRAIDIARQTQLAQPTVQRMLRALVEEQMVEQDPESRRYVIGPEAVLLGLARGAPLRIRTLADAALTSLCHESGDSVYLTVRTGADSICIDRRIGAHPIQVLSAGVGIRRPLGVGAAGLVLLASEDDAEVERIVQRNLPRLAASGLTRRGLLDNIETTRARGFAFKEVGVVPGTRALSVPVPDRGAVVAAISISTVSARLSTVRSRELLRAMREHADQVTKKLARAA
ncbi:IclR family transcriptional regulator [Ramlibacter sp.]|uniref:IclR family transcriptional regulator n=1 Tax=Ramlibacter sp. TaxID=1917967 RepID=UPI003D132EF5